MSKLPFYFSFFLLIFSSLFPFSLPFSFFPLLLIHSNSPPVLPSSFLSSSPFLRRPNRAPSPPAASGPAVASSGPPSPAALGPPATASSRRRRPPQGPLPTQDTSATGRLRAPCRHDLLPPPLAASGVLAAASSLRRRPPSPRWAA